MGCQQRGDEDEVSGRDCLRANVTGCIKDSRRRTERRARPE